VPAGSLGPESAAFDLAQPTAGQRIERLAEACTILRRLWTENDQSTSTDSTTISKTRVAYPGPFRRHARPSSSAESANRKLLRVAAEHADIWNMPGPPHLTVADFTRKNRVLDEYCAQVHRDPTEITRSVQLNADLRCPAATRTHIAELADAGASHIILSGPNHQRRAGTVRQIVDTIIAPAKALVGVMLYLRTDN